MGASKPGGDLGEVKGFDPTAFGQKGIGQKDLTELQKRGYTKKAISNYVESERAKGTQIGGRVDASIGLMGKMPTQKGPVQDYDVKAFGGEGFGFEDVKELANRGYGGGQIKRFMHDLEKQGVNIGPRAGMSIDFMSGMRGVPPQFPFQPKGPRVNNRPNDYKRKAGSVFGMTDGSRF
tara:strand:+ start:332 stop:865 length:534 start_codon:yes stop_codon:yes gene_type:complete